MPTRDAKVEELVRDLPDAEGARRFYAQVAAEHPRAARRLDADPGLLSDALALTAWSPLLATTLAQSPEHLAWLARERTDPRVRSTEELRESLARFALTHTRESPHVAFARFRRRELLRIYLHDIRHTATVVETTEELSNLADAVLSYALDLARQELDNLHGSPLARDARGRRVAAKFTVVALGKLGSRELNYSSDIDLLFLYDADGETSGAGTRGATSNREYFNRLAASVARLVGQQTGEGAAYRVDLRLRPHGRDGALAVSLEEAARYYERAAHAWELQALLRARASAGAHELFARFYERARPRVYSHAGSVEQALSNVRLAKRKIDREQRERGRGFNVKLGRGGVREIEFIAQALQLAHGARDPWLHAPHTLVSLGRLADRGHVTERERTELSDAYKFLRALEHRLQMEHGLQTHTVPAEDARRALVARRMNFGGGDALAQFDGSLAAHTANVRAAFARVFDERDADDEHARTSPRGDEPTTRNGGGQPRRDESTRRDAGEALASSSTGAHDPSHAGEPSRDDLSQSHAGARVAAARRREPRDFGAVGHEARDFRAVLRAAVDRERNFRAELGALRRAWSELIADVWARDAAGETDARESNRLQTELATASLNVGLLVARRELARRHGGFAAGPRLAVLALGRLASGGMDYGSDLDIVCVFDPRVPPPVVALTREQFYARLVELMTTALSSLTRGGHLYRVDLRLRPDGRNGALAQSAQGFAEYAARRAQIWEWLAYVKLRAAAGDLALGRAAEERARRTIHERARAVDREELRRETRRVRERLERERAARASHAVDIKFAAGGMLDVYFAARYLQLRDDVRDEGADRSTFSTLSRLRDAGSLSPSDFDALGEGYATLRSLDHALRLVAGRSARLPAAADHPLVAQLARALRFESPSSLLSELRARMGAVRAAYERVTG